MRVNCTTMFLDGTDRFEAGDTRTVSDERGSYFVANGWATANGQTAGNASQGDASLAIANSTIGQEASHG